MSAASEVTKALGAIDIAAAIDSLPAASRKRLLAEFKEKPVRRKIRLVMKHRK